jgi:hypothetical protein
MQLIVKPISASLTHDTETFSRMVNTYSFRIHIVFVLLMDKDKKQELIKKEENNQGGMIHLCSLLLIHQE